MSLAALFDSLLTQSDVLALCRQFLDEILATIRPRYRPYLQLVLEPHNIRLATERTRVFLSSLSKRYLLGSRSLLPYDPTTRSCLAQYTWSADPSAVILTWWTGHQDPKFGSQHRRRRSTRLACVPAFLFVIRDSPVFDMVRCEARYASLWKRIDPVWEAVTMQTMPRSISAILEASRSLPIRETRHSPGLDTDTGEASHKNPPGKQVPADVAERQIVEVGLEVGSEVGLEVEAVVDAGRVIDQTVIEPGHHSEQEHRHDHERMESRKRTAATDDVPCEDEPPDPNRKVDQQSSEAEGNDGDVSVASWDSQVVLGWEPGLGNAVPSSMPGREEAVNHFSSSPPSSTPNPLLLQGVVGGLPISIHQAAYNSLANGENVRPEIVDFCMAYSLTMFTSQHAADKILALPASFHKSVKSENQLPRSYATGSVAATSYIESTSDLFESSLVLIPVEANRCWSLVLIVDPGNVIPPCSRKVSTDPRSRVSRSVDPSWFFRVSSFPHLNHEHPHHAAFEPTARLFASLLLFSAEPITRTHIIACHDAVTDVNTDVDGAGDSSLMSVVHLIELWLIRCAKEHCSSAMARSRSRSRKGQGTKLEKYFRDLGTIILHEVAIPDRSSTDSGLLVAMDAVAAVNHFDSLLQCFDVSPRLLPLPVVGSASTRMKVRAGQLDKKGKSGESNAQPVHIRSATPPQVAEPTGGSSLGGLSDFFAGQTNPTSREGWKALVGRLAESWAAEQNVLG